MSRRDNDSLEEFFRKATSHPDLKFNEGDWANLEKRLDVELGAPPPAGARSKLKRIIPALAILAFVSVSLWLWRGPQDNTANRPRETNSPHTRPAPADDMQEEWYTAHSGEEGAGDIQSPTSKDQATDQRREDINTVSEGAAGTGSNKATSGQRGTPTQNNNARANWPEPGRENESSHTRDTKHETWITPSENSTSGFSPSRPDPQERQNMIDEGAPAESLLAETDASADTPDSTRTVGLTEDEENTARFATGRFGVSIVVAPDFSMTAGGGTMGVGEAAGVMLHYRVFDRWGITVGALHNTKKYWGPGSEYRPPRGYWKALTNGIVPDRIDGTCAMYEVPVSVTFDVVQTRRSRLFVGAGLSSYFMRNEEYYYKFDDPNPGAVRGWSGEKPRTLWFGIGTISAGYDFRATRSLSFGVEPYFKVPLEGIGWADVDLYSTGLMFAARYHFMKSGNKHPPPSHEP